jgi:hypothetical protein
MESLAAFVLLASLSSAVPPGHSPGVWADAMNDAWHIQVPGDDLPVLSSSVVTSEINDASGDARSRLLLICQDRKLQLRLEWSFSAAGKASLRVGYQFGDQPEPRQLRARYLSRNQEVITSAEDIRQFLADAASAQSENLLVHVRSDLGGTLNARFRAAGSADMVKQVAAACPDYAP